jgi:NADH dehydrogenase
MIVFVTGGTGFVGREIVRELNRAGHKLRLLVRDRKSPAAQEMVWRHAAELREGNVLDPASLPGALQGADAVIHLVGIISEVGEQTFERAHTRATQNMVGAAKATGVRRFLHMSALGTRAHAPSRYHQTKWAAEQIVSHSALNWTIFRPSVIYGPEDAFVNLFARLAKFSPILPVMGDGRAVLQPVAVEDVARCYVGALGEPRSIRKTFDVCGPDKLTMPQILRAILAATHRKSLIVRVPIRLARVLAASLEFVYPRLLRKAPPLNRDQLLMLQEDNVGEPRRTVEMFGLRQNFFADGIARYLKRDS